MVNFVELIAEEQAFDQDCKFANHVKGHSIYCHSKHPDAPRKCIFRMNESEMHTCPYFNKNDNVHNL